MIFYLQPPQLHELSVHGFMWFVPGFVDRYFNQNRWKMSTIYKIDKVGIHASLPSVIHASQFIVVMIDI